MTSHNQSYEAEELIIHEGMFISSLNRSIPYQPTILTLLSQYDWKIETAFDVLMAESGGNPQAINWQDSHKNCVGSFGYFQLGCIHGTADELLDPIKNIEVAYKVYSKSGTSAWSVCNKKIVDCSDW